MLSLLMQTRVETSFSSARVESMEYFLQCPVRCTYGIEAFADFFESSHYICQLILPMAGAGTLCDILITSSIFKYLWKSGFRRQRTVIQDLAVVCINMGAFTW